MFFFFVFRLVTSLGPKKILSPHEESNLRPSDCYFEVLTNIEYHKYAGLFPGDGVPEMNYHLAVGNAIFLKRHWNLHRTNYLSVFSCMSYLCCSTNICVKYGHSFPKLPTRDDLMKNQPYITSTKRVCHFFIVSLSNFPQFSQITNARRFNEKSALHNINQTCLSLFHCESFQLVN